MEFSLKIEKTFRYETLHEEAKPGIVLYVLHGYGQLARYFIRKFSNVSEDILIVAPEGMHRFYQKGASGRVGASWMTKEAREDDISDNITFLNSLDKVISEKFNIEKRYLLGFSQGGATAARWQQLGTVSFDALILWACVFPPDLPLNVEAQRNDLPRYFAIGSEDEFYDDSAQQKLIEEYQEMGYAIQRYEGRHDVINETLTEILRQIRRKE